MKESARYLDPEVLSRAEDLELRARLIVEGTLAGLNRSPYYGFSVEFAEHRPYVWGDDLKHIDWKVWARADRYYVKSYEEETNLSAHLLVDSSNSMRYASGALSKYDYCCTLAASLGYLLLGQQDAIGLTLFDSAVREGIPPSSRGDQLQAICRAMENARPRQKTAVGPLLHQVAERIAPRSVVILLSDLLVPTEDIISGIRHLRYSRHEVIVWHVLDPDELDFPFEGNVEFAGLESGERLRADGRQLRSAYLEALQEHREQVGDACGRLKVDYFPVSTSERPDIPLTRFLAARRAGSRALR